MAQTQSRTPASLPQSREHGKDPQTPLRRVVSVARGAQIFPSEFCGFRSNPKLSTHGHRGLPRAVELLVSRRRLLRCQPMEWGGLSVPCSRTEPGRSSPGSCFTCRAKAMLSGDPAPHPGTRGHPAQDTPAQDTQPCPQHPRPRHGQGKRPGGSQQPQKPNSF